MYKRVLVPLDGSTKSEVALNVVRQLAKTPGFQVHLLVAINMGQVLFSDRQDTLPTNFQALGNQQLEEARSYLTEIQDQLQAEGIQCQTHVVQQDPRDAIPEVASQNDIELLLMASIGKSNWMRWISGSITEQVLRNAPCPVLVVRP